VTPPTTRRRRTRATVGDDVSTGESSSDERVAAYGQQKNERMRVPAATLHAYLEAILWKMGFAPSKADLDLWILKVEVESFENIASCVDEKNCGKQESDGFD
jgi:hypothetical protein